MLTRRRRQKRQKKRKTLKRTRHRRRLRLRSYKQRGGDTENIVNPNAVFARQHPYDYNMCSSIMHPAKSPDFTFRV